MTQAPVLLALPLAPRYFRGVKIFERPTRIDVGQLGDDTLRPLADRLNEIGVNLPEALEALNDSSKQGFKVQNALLSKLNYGSSTAELRIQLDHLSAYLEKPTNKLKGESATNAAVPQASPDRLGY